MGDKINSHRRRSVWVAAALALLVPAGCDVEPMPSIAAPHDVILSAVEVGVPDIAVIGRAGSVPSLSVVIVGNGARPDVATVTASATGSFLARVPAEPGDQISVRVQDGPAVTRMAKSAADAGTPPKPGDGGGEIAATVDGGRVSVTGAAQSVSADADVLLATAAEALVVVADGVGAFRAELAAGDDGLISVVALVDGQTSAALVLGDDAGAGTGDTGGTGGDDTGSEDTGEESGSDDTGGATAEETDDTGEDTAEETDDTGEDTAEQTDDTGEDTAEGTDDTGEDTTEETDDSGDDGSDQTDETDETDDDTDTDEDSAETEETPEPTG